VRAVTAIKADGPGRPSTVNIDDTTTKLSKS
jgi:hypothetical protein